MSHLCDPAPGLPDLEEPQRVLAGCRLPLLNLPTQRYRPTSNKVTTKGGGIHFAHPQGPVVGGASETSSPPAVKAVGGWGWMCLYRGRPRNLQTGLTESAGLSEGSRPHLLVPDQPAPHVCVQGASVGTSHSRWTSLWEETCPLKTTLQLVSSWMPFSLVQMFLLIQEQVLVLQAKTRILLILSLILRCPEQCVLHVLEKQCSFST